MNEKEIENNLTLFKAHFSKAMYLLDELNELISDIEWDVGENEISIREVTLLTDLQYAIEDTEATLSDALYSDLYEVYNEGDE